MSLDDRLDRWNVACPQMYGRSGSLSNWVFWRYAVLTAIVGGAASFFIPYYAIVTSGQNSVADLYSVGKIVMIIIVAVVRMSHHVLRLCS